MKSVPFHELTDDQKRDLVVAVGLGEIDAAIPAARELFSLFALDEPVASDFTTYSREITSMDEEEIMGFLEGKVPADRFEELNNGNALTPDEQATVIANDTRSRCEGGEDFHHTQYFRLTDSKGRNVYFSQTCNDDCGSTYPPSDQTGPFSELPYEADGEHVDDHGNIASFCIF